MEVCTCEGIQGSDVVYILCFSLMRRVGVQREVITAHTYNT